MNVLWLWGTGGMSLAGETDELEENLFHRNYNHHRSDSDWPGFGQVYNDMAVWEMVFGKS
jgi:hypothetical protein